MEQARKHVNIRLIVDPSKLLEAVSKVTFRQSEIINRDLVIVRNKRKQVTLNKPITVGFLSSWNSPSTSCIASTMTS